MLKKILVVESPNKTREISHMKLGEEPKATLGHIMDLLRGKEAQCRITFQGLLSAPWLIKVSKRFRDAFKEVEELIAERDGQDEVRIG